MENPPAFPVEDLRDQYGNGIVQGHPGMTLRDWFAGQALCIARFTLPDYELDALFGKLRTGIKRHEIIAADAYQIADAMLTERAKGGEV